MIYVCTSGLVRFGLSVRYFMFWVKFTCRWFRSNYFHRKKDSVGGSNWTRSQIKWEMLNKIWISHSWNTCSLNVKFGNTFCSYFFLVFKGYFVPNVGVCMSYWLNIDSPSWGDYLLCMLCKSVADTAAVILRFMSLFISNGLDYFCSIQKSPIKTLLMKVLKEKTQATSATRKEWKLQSLPTQAMIR